GRDLSESLVHSHTPTRPATVSVINRRRVSDRTTCPRAACGNKPVPACVPPLDRDDAMLAGALAFVPAPDEGVEAYRIVGRLHVGPAQVAVAALAVAVPLALAVGQPHALDHAAVRGVVADRCEAFNC